ncbi:hypothetical protein QFC19_006473 [Naganishia cerealis]|uniref:Uncharacterized protein n=1 Tax=Naganishia cerealis TaxID=610337 RepID=A0ACC2VG29_9TREE|nr:hypothetical protein QFC19_006473 [Naganishia cerealis]
MSWLRGDWITAIMPLPVKRSAVSSADTETSRRVKFRSEVASRHSLGSRTRTAWNSRDEEGSSSSESDVEEDKAVESTVRVSIRASVRQEVH